LNSIGERLKAERQRLGKSQTEFGKIAGIQKLAQINYEKGERVPDAAKLAAWAQAGVDVMYVLTGNRASNGPPLSPEEAALVDNYRHCPPSQQAILRETSNVFAKHNDNCQDDCCAG